MGVREAWTALFQASNSQKRMVKEALNAIRLNKPYKRNEDLPISKDWK